MEITPESFEELKLVDDYDRWQHDLGERTHWFAEFNKDFDVDDWVRMIRRSGTGMMKEYLEDGAILFNMKIARINDVIKTGLQVVFREKWLKSK